MVGAAMCVAACHPGVSRDPATSFATWARDGASAAMQGNTEKRAPAFVQSSCGSCHAVERYGSSPHPNAPAFADIANREGLTADTLSAWLRDAHNYPEEMNFYLDPSNVERLTAYLLTLRDPSYRPPI